MPSTSPVMTASIACSKGCTAVPPSPAGVVTSGAAPVLAAGLATGAWNAICQRPSAVRQAKPTVLPLVGVGNVVFAADAAALVEERVGGDRRQRAGLNRLGDWRGLERGCQNAVSKGGVIVDRDRFDTRSGTGRREDCALGHIA